MLSINLQNGMVGQRQGQSGFRFMGTKGKIVAVVSRLDSEAAESDTEP